MKINEKTKKGLIIGGVISIILVLGLVLFNNPAILSNLVGGVFNNVQTFTAENGLETETGTIDGTSIILEQGDKQTGPNVVMIPGIYKIVYQGSNFYGDDIKILVAENEIDFEEIEVLNNRFEFEIEILTNEPINIELINNSERTITIDRIIVTRLSVEEMEVAEEAEENEIKEEEREQEEQPVELPEEDYENLRVIETITFSPYQLRFEGNGVRNNDNLILRSGAMQLGPNLPVTAGTFRVIYHGANLRTNDVISAFQFDPYIALTISNIETRGTTLSFLITIPVNLSSLELLYQNIGTENVVINRIVLERLGN